MASKKKSSSPKSNAKVGRASPAKAKGPEAPLRFETDMPLDARGAIDIDGVYEPTFLSVMTGTVDLRARNEHRGGEPAPVAPVQAPPAAPPPAVTEAPAAAAPEEPARFTAVTMPSMNVELAPPPGMTPGVDNDIPAVLRDNKTPHAHQQVMWTGPLPNVSIDGLTRHGGPGIAHVMLSLPKGAHKLDLLGITLHPSIRNNLLLRQVFHSNNVPYYDPPHDMSLEGWNTSEANLWIPQGLVIREDQPVVLLLVNPRPERVIVFGAFTGMLERFVPIGPSVPGA